MRGFVDRLAERGHLTHVYEHPNVDDRPLVERIHLRQRSLADWIERLPRPTGVLVTRDRLAVDFLELLASLDVRVPDDLAVLGTDDWDILCETSDPPLASVRPASEQVGFEAARLLAEMVNGGTRQAPDVQIPPLGVTVRQSADIFAAPDELLRRALRHIQEHASERIDVNGLVRAMGCDRRLLEQRFRSHLGRTPLDEIQRVRVELAKTQLAETSLSVAEIAVRSGFRDATHLGVIFRRLAGTSPSAYRKAITRPQATSL